jgi:hypothetical protein
MPRLTSAGLLLLAAAALAACTSGGQRYAAAGGTTGGGSPPPVAAAPPDEPATGSARANAHNNPAISFAAAGRDRKALDAAANQYCAGQGKIAALSGRTASRFSYDCIPARAVAAAPPRTNGNGAGNPDISYDATQSDRQALARQAAAYCAAQGKTAALSGRSGSRISYDCVPLSDAAAPPPPTPRAPAWDPTAPSVTYQLVGDNRRAIEGDAATYCGAQGRSARFLGQEGTRLTYGCVADPGRPAPAAPTVAVMESAAAPPAAPTITYDVTADGAQAPDAPAVRYCGTLGKSPVLRAQDGGTLTYECR